MELEENDYIDSWLSPEDIERIWRVGQGELPDTAATAEEIEEFDRVVKHVLMLKAGGSGYQDSTIQ